MKNFRVERPIKHGEQPPDYLVELPPLISGYQKILEVLNLTNGKHRIIACEQTSCELFMNYFNLVAAYRTYLAAYSESGPEYITEFVKNYRLNKGELIIDNQNMEKNQLQYLLAFGRENSSIKKLTFSEGLQFENVPNPKKIDSLNQVISLFNGDSITCLKFLHNNITDDILRKISQGFSNQQKLITLQISQNLLSTQSLELFASTIFKENRNLQNIVLNNNLIGEGAQAKDSMTNFLESFLLDLKNPLVLDLSYNRINDDCLLPIVKYLFANTECKIHMLNIEHNALTNYAKRTIAQAQILCNNQNLIANFGPLPLTSVNLKVCTTQPKGLNTNGPLDQGESVEVVIRRKPIDPIHGLSFLPTSKEGQSQIQHQIDKIKKIVSAVEASKITVEEIREAVSEITNLQFEFPRHLLEPLFDLVNEKCKAAIHHQDIYSLEVLLDTLAMMNARNATAEQEYHKLSQKAHSVADNLIKAINMEIHDDNEMLKVLVDNIAIAKQIGMRGEVIDVAVTLKALCTKFLQEMVQNAGNEEENTEHAQVFVLREKDQCSVFDPKYQKYADQIGYEKLGITSELEPQLAFHPNVADYLKIAALNLHYTKKNLIVSRKLVYDEETYGTVNVYTRCAYMLTDGLPDMAKNLTLSQIRDDHKMKIARLLFRYRHNLDNLFPKTVNARFNIEAFENSLRDKMFIFQGIQKGLKVEDFMGLYSIQKAQSLQFQLTAITRPLSRLNSIHQDKAIKFNELLTKLCNQKLNEIQRPTYRLIQTMFQNFIIKQGKLPASDMCDEIYLQLYKNLNYGTQTEDKDRSRVIFLIFALVSKYLEPGQNLKGLLSSWLLSKKDERSIERFVKLILQNFKMQKIADGAQKPYINWPPSLASIEALDKNKSFEVQISWPNAEISIYPIDDFTTIENLLQKRVYKERFFVQEPDPEMYWLFTNEEEGLPVPVPKDKKVAKLIYEDENDSQQKEESILMAKSRNANERRTTYKMQTYAQQEDKREFALLIRKRIFSSLHTLPNFKVLSNPARSFLYHQMRQDYTDREILTKPNLSAENAVLLAALALKIKFQTKILRSKENSLTLEIISKNLEYCLPKSFIRDKQNKDTWPEKIFKAFQDHNMKEQSMQEAQDQFLILLASFDFMFASCYVVRRNKNNHGDILKKVPTKRPQFKSRQRNQESSSESESDSELSSSLDSDVSDQSHHKSPQKNGLKVTSEEEQAARKRLEVFEEHFQNTADSLLLICKQDCLLFVDNRTRNQIFLELMYEELIYCMGKGNQLKLGMLVQKKLIPDGQYFDVRTDFTANHARVIAEDIMTYCQLYLLEHTQNATDYLEIVKKNAFEMFNQDDFEGFTTKRGENAAQPGQSATKINFQIAINDELLKGQPLIKKDTKETLMLKGKKALLKLQQKSFSQDVSRESLRKKSIDSEDDVLSVKETAIKMEEESLLEEKSSLFRTATGTEKIYGQMSHQFKLRQPNFFVFFKNHPCHVSSQQDLEDSIRADNENADGKTIGKHGKDPEVVFNLANHTIGQIDEESEPTSDVEEIQPITQNLLGVPKQNHKSIVYPNITLEAPTKVTDNLVMPKQAQTETSRLSKTPTIIVNSPDSSSSRASLISAMEPNKTNNNLNVHMIAEDNPQKQNVPQQEEVKQPSKSSDENTNYADFLAKLNKSKDTPVQVSSSSDYNSNDKKPQVTGQQQPQVLPVVQPQHLKPDFQNQTSEQKRRSLQGLFKQMGPPPK